jgi:hypothetical protein
MTTYSAIPQLTKFLNQGAAPKPDYAANLALFLLQETGSIYNSWEGRMTAKQQREIFGQYLGKGKIYISGSCERVEHWVKVCFGHDSECTKRLWWKDL